LRSLFQILFGSLTLLVARFSAIKESDRKKVVALSTLRQLGLIFLALVLGGVLICLIHVIIHAFAKANLFLNVGNVLHSRFSQQDSRAISSGDEDRSLFISVFISVFSLSGTVFFSGFFSKECILAGEVGLISSACVLLLLLSMISLTISYCLLFVSLISILIQSYVLVCLKKREFFIFPIILISLVTILAGFLFRSNLFYVSLIMCRLSGLY
jgi:NADH-quinone oxidoreductase subunit L